MSTTTLHHSVQTASPAKTSPSVVKRFIDLFSAARQAKANQETLRYLRGLDDKALMDFGYSYSAVRELRAGHLPPVSF